MTTLSHFRIILTISRSVLLIILHHMLHSFTHHLRNLQVSVRSVVPFTIYIYIYLYPCWPFHVQLCLCYVPIWPFYGLFLQWLRSLYWYVLYLYRCEAMWFLKRNKIDHTCAKSLFWQHVLSLGGSTTLTWSHKRNIGKVESIWETKPWCLAWRVRFK